MTTSSASSHSSASPVSTPSALAWLSTQHARLMRWGNHLSWLQPLVLLGARLYVAKAFFLSGLTKLRDWETTLFLFTDEYKVPLLPPELAAVMGTAGELALPVLLVLGLGGRFAALGLSVVNVVAVLSLAEIAPAALGQHHLWGSLLVMVAAFGPGAWSLDRALARGRTV